jgi:transposase-like protein
MSLRKIIKTRGSFPSEEAAMKLLYLALRNVSWRQGGNGHLAEPSLRFRIIQAVLDLPFQEGRVGSREGL